jgi:hypothetical protein
VGHTVRHMGFRDCLLGFFSEIYEVYFSFGRKLYALAENLQLSITIYREGFALRAG